MTAEIRFADRGRLWLSTKQLFSINIGYRKTIRVRVCSVLSRKNSPKSGKKRISEETSPLEIRREGQWARKAGRPGMSGSGGGRFFLMSSVHEICSQEDGDAGNICDVARIHQEQAADD